MSKNQSEKFESLKNYELKSWFLILLVLSFFGLLYFVQLGGRALWSEELRWAQIPREMLQSKEYFLPTINGNTYYDKPLGSYWLVLFSSWCTGAMDELACRLPSAISGMISVLFTMLIALRLYDQKTAIYSGIILGTSYSFVFSPVMPQPILKTSQASSSRYTFFLCMKKSLKAGGYLHSGSPWRLPR